MDMPAGTSGLDPFRGVILHAWNDHQCPGWKAIAVSIGAIIPGGLYSSRAVLFGHASLDIWVKAAISSFTAHFSIQCGRN